MRIFKLVIILIFTNLYYLGAQESYFTHISDKLIQTLQVKVADELISTPCIELDSDKLIEVNFDAIHSGVGRYAYNLIYCNADWTRSSLSPIEYMDGFQGCTIEDFANAIGTTVSYSNYRLLFPNEDMRPKLSGNYALQIYKEDNPSQIVCTACFSIVEPLVGISASVSGNTDIDTNLSHQQVSFAIDNKDFPILYPQTDLKVWVYQNNRRDNAVTQLQPTSLLEDQIVYANNRSLIFPAGNEFRRMEFLSNKYNGMQVEAISYHNPYYHVDLMTDFPRKQISYQYDQDQDGRFFIRCSGCNDPDTEADYNIVHFSLATDYLPGGDLYLNGELFNNILDEKSRMVYNPESQRYEKSVLLKQGSYNYQYLYVPNGSSQGETAPIEGNFFQTENEYGIYVYYRPMGARYDRLIGVTFLRNITPVL